MISNNKSQLMNIESELQQIEISKSEKLFVMRCKLSYEEKIIPIISVNLVN